VLEIQDYVAQMYGAPLSTGQISAITDRIWEEVVRWKSRVLSSFYVLIYLDAIYFRIRENGRVITKAIYTVYGINAHGERDILDLHVGQAEAEGAKEWGRLLEKIKERGVEDVLFFAVDGLVGFKEVILEVFPRSIVQRCIVHMIRTSLKFVADQDYRAICKDLRNIYSADDEAAGLQMLDKFAQKWDGKYSEISRKWKANWTELTAFFGYNAAIRKLIYTTNAVEGLHRIMRKVTKTKGAFTNEKALLKILYLNLIRNPKSWKRKVFNWSAITRGLSREFGERFNKHLDDDTILMN
jgi:transposase-like protein